MSSFVDRLRDELIAEWKRHSMRMDRYDDEIEDLERSSSTKNQRDFRTIQREIARKREARKKEHARHMKKVHYLVPTEEGVDNADIAQFEKWWLADPPLPPTWEKKAYAEVYTDSILPGVKDYPSWLRYWALFFSNKVYIPTYSVLWISSRTDRVTQFSEDDSMMLRLGEQLADLTKRGIFTFDGQDADTNPDNTQKAYLMGIAPSEFKSRLDDVNLESGIALTVWELEVGKMKSNISTAVTWDEGDAFSFLYVEPDLMAHFLGSDLVHPEMKQIFARPNAWVGFHVVDAVLGRNNIIQSLRKHLPLMGSFKE